MTENDLNQQVAFDRALDDIARTGNLPWLPSSDEDDPGWRERVDTEVYPYQTATTPVERVDTEVYPYQTETTPVGADLRVRPPAEDTVADLASTARRLKDLFAHQRAVPDDRFVSRLEQRLMPGLAKPLTPTPQPAMALNGHLPANPARATPAKRRFASLTPVISMALLLALIAATGFIVWQGDGSEDPRSIAFPVASDGTPEAAAAEATPDSGFLWELPASSEAMMMVNSGFTVQGNTVYRFLRIPTEFNGIEAIDGQTGQTRWRATAYWWRGILAADEHGVYYFGFGETTREGALPVLVALSPETGDELWRLDLEDQPWNVSTKDGRLYFDTLEDDVIAIDAIKGEKLWRHEGHSQPGYGGIAPLPGTRPAILDHAIALFRNDGSIAGLDPDTGAELWRSEGFHPEAVFLTPAGDILIAMSAYEWEGMTGTPGTPSPKDGETLWAAGTANFRLIGIASADGRILWEQMVAAPLLQHPAIAGSTFAFVGDEAIPVEEHNSIVPKEHQPSPISEGSGHVFYLWASFSIRAIDITSGELLWTESLNGDIYNGVAGWTSPSGTGGGMAAITSYGNVVAEGPWTGGKLDPPGDLYSVVGALQAGDFGFVALTADGRLVGIEVEPEVNE
jgi:outer membrane protein assembly factor BamB